MDTYHGVDTFHVRNWTQDTSRLFASLEEARAHLGEVCSDGDDYTIWEVVEGSTVGADVQNGTWRG